jgi:hypothetical protein
VRFLVSVALFTVLAVGAASGGSYTPPGGDWAPLWLSDGSIVFSGRDGLGAVHADGAGARAVYSGWVGVVAVAPTLPLVSFATIDKSGKLWLAVASTDGSQTRLLVEGGVPVGWTGDSSRLIFSVGSDADRPGAQGFYSIRPDGTDETPYPATVHGTPSPDASRFAYATADVNGENARLRLVDAGDGDELTVAAARPASADGPFVWSRDGSRIAYWGSGAGVLAVSTVGGAARSYRIVDRIRVAGPAWSADGRSIYLSSSRGLVGIDLACGKERLLVPSQLRHGLCTTTSTATRSTAAAATTR